MNFQFTPWSRWPATALRFVVTLRIVLVIVGLQWKKPMEGVSVFFLDRLDSIPAPQQEAARRLCLGRVLMVLAP